jgi:hypothetical protein
VGVGLIVCVASLFMVLGRDDANRQHANSESTLFGDVAGVLLGVGCLAIGAVVYFVPTVIAITRKHHNAPAIAALNILTGWSFIGWVGALVWAFTQVDSRDHYHFHTHEP